MLFRGQSDSKWRLETTLERAVKTITSFQDYFVQISRIKPEIEALTEKSWELPTYKEFMGLIEGYEGVSWQQTMETLPGVSFMAYLRHHGYPSPLLDWTRSPYVAAFFAFSGAKKASDVSIYVLRKTNTQSHSSLDPRVSQIVSIETPHKRHVLQQCRYSVSLEWTEKTWHFSSHEKVFRDESGWQNFQVIKLNLPGSERGKVLRSLDEHNLNAFSLFGSEDSLMETLSFRGLQNSGRE